MLLVIGLDVLGEKWTPNLSIVTSKIGFFFWNRLLLLCLIVVLLQIIALMADPSTESPLMPAIAKQIQKNPREFYETARKYAATYAQFKNN